MHLHLAAARGAAPAATGTKSPGDAPTWQHADERIVGNAKAILLRDLGAAITLADLAHAVGTNERSLTEAFRRQTGMAVFEFLRQERFRGACELLLHSAMLIGQIGTAMSGRGQAVGVRSCLLPPAPPAPRSAC